MKHRYLKYGIYLFLIIILSSVVKPNEAAATTSTVPHGTYISATAICEICHVLHEGKASSFNDESNLSFEESNIIVETTGAWSTTNSPVFSDGSAIESSQTGALVSFKYAGAQGIEWIGASGPDKGKATVYSDGQYLGSVDLYTSEPVYQTRIRAFGGTENTRTITIKVSGTKNPDSSDTAVNIDAFLVTAQKVSLINSGDDKAVCYTCHNGTGGTIDTMTEFGDTSGTTPPVSRHPVPEREITCSSCHSPHKQIENWDGDHSSNEVIRLLRGIFRLFLGYIVSDDNISWLDLPQNDLLKVPAQRKLVPQFQFCGSCHGQTGKLGDKTTYYEGTGHDLTVTVTPKAESGISCLTCHEWHVAPNMPKLLLERINVTTITANDNELCYSCHPVSALDPTQYYQVTSPTGDIHGLGESTETTSEPGLRPPYNYRMDELLCKTCHDPHGSKSLFWMRDTINEVDVDIEDASDSVGITSFCSACHEPSYIHSGSPPDGCFTCHFHGANSVDTDTQTRF